MAQILDIDDPDLMAFIRQEQCADPELGREFGDRITGWTTVKPRLKNPIAKVTDEFHPEVVEMLTWVQDAGRPGRVYIETNIQKLPKGGWMNPNRIHIVVFHFTDQNVGFEFKVRFG
jgi:hypothetical protein